MEDNWNEYRRLILAELESVRLELRGVNAKIDALQNTEISNLKVAVAMLQVRSAGLGAIMGIVVTVILQWLKR